MLRKATAKQARALRRSAPLTERVLWKLLRGRRLADLKFRRQVPLGPYVLDFVCHRHKLVVEADGPFHDPAHDQKRDAYLASQGFRVVRLTNHEIAASEEAVVMRILQTIGPEPAGQA